MAELGAGIDWGMASKVQAPNFLQNIKDVAQMQSYTLDTAAKARNFSALQKWGTAAAAGDQEAINNLAGNYPEAMAQIAGLTKTGVETKQAKDNLTNNYLARGAGMLGQLPGHEQRGFYDDWITRGQQAGLLDADVADKFRSMAIRNPNMIPTIAQATTRLGMPPEATPEARASGAIQTYEGESPTRVWEAGVGQTWQQPNVIYVEDPKTGKLVPRDVPRLQTPGAFQPGGPTLQRPPSQAGRPYGVAPSAPATGSAPAAPGGSSTAPGSAPEYGGGGDDIPEARWNSMIYGPESRNDPNAANPYSSARGQGQFLTSTWAMNMRKLHPEETQGLSDQQVAQKFPRSDQRNMTDAMRSNRNINAQALADRGLPVTSASLAMSHQLGPGGAAAVLNADPSTPMTAILGPEASRANPRWARMTAGQFRSAASNVYTDRPVRGTETRGAAPPAEGTTAPAEATAPAASATPVPPGPIRSLTGGVAPGEPTPLRPGMSPPPGTPPGPATPPVEGTSGSSMPPGSTDAGAGSDTGAAAGAPVTPTEAASPVTTEASGGGDTIAPSPGGGGMIGTPRPSQEDLERQKSVIRSEEKERDVPTQLREFEGQREIETSNKIMSDSVNESRAAETGLRQLTIVRRALDKAVTGKTAPLRMEIYSRVGELARLVGVGAPAADIEASRLKLIQTAGSELGFAMVNALGSREAMQVVSQVMGIKPNIENSNAQNQMIVDALRQGFQRSIDKREYMEANKTKHGNYQKAETAFNKENPPDMYASRVTPFDVEYNKDGGIDKSQMHDKFTYDLSGIKPSKDAAAVPEGTRGVWDKGANDGRGGFTQISRSPIYR